MPMTSATRDEAGPRLTRPICWADVKTAGVSLSWRLPRNRIAIPSAVKSMTTATMIKMRDIAPPLRHHAFDTAASAETRAVYCRGLPACFRDAPFGSGLRRDRVYQTSLEQDTFVQRIQILPVECSI